MNANLKKIVGAAVAALSLAMVACGGSGGGGSNNGTGVNCVQMGATCVAMPPGYVSQGTWRNGLVIPNGGAADVTVRLTPNGGFGLGGGYGFGGVGGGYGYPGYGQTAPVTTTISITVRPRNGYVIQAQGIVSGSAGGFSAALRTANGLPLNISATFTDSTQAGMSVVLSGAVTASGLLTDSSKGNTQGLPYGFPPNGGIGWGNPGYDYGYPVDPWW